MLAMNNSFKMYSERIDIKKLTCDYTFCSEQTSQEENGKQMAAAS